MSNQRFATGRSRIRTKVAVGAVCAGLLGVGFVTEQASAAAPAPQMAGAVAPAQGPAADSSGALAMAAPVAVHGVADDGSELFGTFQLERLQTHGGVMYAVGDLAGTLGTRSVTKHNVRIPVILGSEPSTAVAGLPRRSHRPDAGRLQHPHAQPRSPRPQPPRPTRGPRPSQPARGGGAGCRRTGRQPAVRRHQPAQRGWPRCAGDEPSDGDHEPAQRPAGRLTRPGTVRAPPPSPHGPPSGAGLAR